MSEFVLMILWYLVFLALIGGYVMLDGFDLGVGALHLLARKDHNRRVFLNAIGPVWDGNEVWLVIVSGALFAGFPFAYATIMSSFYNLVMIFLAALIFRAFAIEVRGKVDARWWRSLWDWSFCWASIVIALGLGLTLGNLVHGIPLDLNHRFTGDFGSLFTPYTVLIAFFVLSLCVMHGAIYLVMKTEGEIHDKLRRWIAPAMGSFIVLFVVSTVATLIYEPHMRLRFEEQPWLFFVPALTILAIANIPREIRHGNDGRAFISSSFSIFTLVALFALGMYPNLVRSSVSPELHSLTVFNSYASAKTLGILLIIVCIGIPLALSYIIAVYYIFRGKVRIDSASY